ncbi:GTP cyclohydrolase I FolE [Streptomyces sp. NPDC047049]|uniref:GTP cyclohydrolase I FolE n=1 Tax=Streptomyces sp. NPDC047049 TaxID=3156688 RepID=UPI003410FDDB
MDVLAARLVSSRDTEVCTRGIVDLARIEDAVRDILVAVGEDPDRQGLKETPRRVAHAYAELFAGLRVEPADVLGTTFEEGHREMVMVCDIEVQSFCEHHLLPFIGRAHVGYLPGPSGCVVGLSKLARLVEIYARRPQVQERLTAQIADCLYAALDATGVIVLIEAEHTCMTMRGVRKAGSRTATSALRGAFESDPRSRDHAMELLRRTAA